MSNQDRIAEILAECADLNKLVHENLTRDNELIATLNATSREREVLRESTARAQNLMRELINELGELRSNGST